MKAALDGLSKLFAVFAGIVMVAITLITTGSIVGRWMFNSPLLGDTELVEFAMAFAVAAFMPICQWRGGNIIVDFFTTGASAPLRRRMDQFGALIVALMAALLAWRTGVGAIEQHRLQGTTMLMQLPEWIAYASMVPPLALTAVIALYTMLTGTSGRQ